MVFINKDDDAEILLVADQMLWFSTQLPHSLINPSQIRAYGIAVMYPHGNTAKFNKLRTIQSLEQEKEDLGSLSTGETDLILCSISPVASIYPGDVREKRTSVSLRERLSAVSHEKLSQMWNVGLQTKKDTLDLTT
eukprot:9247065-Ditylum_brightwellii.AAC.1